MAGRGRAAGARAGDDRPAAAADREGAGRDDGGGTDLGGARRLLQARRGNVIRRGAEPHERLRRPRGQARDLRKKTDRHDGEAAHRRVRPARQREDLRPGVGDGGGETRSGIEKRADLGLHAGAAADDGPETRRVRADVGDVLLEDDEPRLERGLLRADGRARPAQLRDAERGVRGVVRLHGDGIEPGQELRALPEDRCLRVDLADVGRGDAVRRGEDEPHGDLDLRRDGERRTSRLEEPRDRLQWLEDRSRATRRRREDGEVDLRRRERAEQAVERREADRASAARRRARREGPGEALVSREQRRGGRGVLRAGVLGDASVHVLLRRRGRNEKGPPPPYRGGGPRVRPGFRARPTRPAPSPSPDTNTRRKKESRSRGGARSSRNRGYRACQVTCRPRLRRERRVEARPPLSAPPAGYEVAGALTLRASRSRSGPDTSIRSRSRRRAGPCRGRVRPRRERSSRPS